MELTSASNSATSHRLALKPAGRLVQLDLLRFIAIMLVIGAHPFMSHADLGALRPVADLWLRFGWTGVDLFFVLSGFLVGGLLFQELQRSGSLDVRRFVLRRWLKIWPAYFVFLALMFSTLTLHHHGVGYALRCLLPNLLHIQNYSGMTDGPDGRPLILSRVSIVHTWSLAVEEHFYLLLPPLLLALRRHLRLFPLLVACISVACLALRLTNLGQEYSSIRNLWPTHLRIDSLFVGVLPAWAYHIRPDLWQRWTARPRLLLGCGLGLIAPMLVFDLHSPFTWTVGFTLLAAGYACILSACMAAADAPFFTSRSVRSMARIGTYSYSIYLLLMSVGRWTANLVARHGHSAGVWLVTMTVYVIVTFIAAVVLSRSIERPMLALRDRLIPSHV
jgi:peptidoglycan/LPS O-acetylase OafA/YrhL